MTQITLNSDKQAVCKLASKVINHLNAINLCSVKGGTDIDLFKGSFD